jgi:cysteine protease ATG4
MSLNDFQNKVLGYLWDKEPLNEDHDNEIVCLGVGYDPSEAAQPGRWPSGFLVDVESKVWLTYRKGFPLIPRAKDGPSPVTFKSFLRGAGADMNGFTSDIGWGCMIRTAQTLLANALVFLKLGRDWRKSTGNRRSVLMENDIAGLFRDDPDTRFSLHNFVVHGEDACGKKPGDWFGPSAAASSIRHLCATTDDLRVYVSNGSDVYEDQVIKVSVDDGEFKPTLILLGLRLGTDECNPVYWEVIKGFLRCRQAVGIAGGRTQASHYFYGYQGDNLFFLDPHHPQTMMKLDQQGRLDAQSMQSVHSQRIRTLHLKQMDPSMLVGFLIRDREDWEDWKNTILQQCRGAVNVSAREPMICARKSISVGSDDTGSYVDVAFGPRPKDFAADDDEDEEEGEKEEEEEEDLIEEPSNEEMVMVNQQDVDISIDGVEDPVDVHREDGSETPEIISNPARFEDDAIEVPIPANGFSSEYDPPVEVVRPDSVSGPHSDMSSNSIGSDDAPVEIARPNTFPARNGDSTVSDDMAVVVEQSGSQLLGSEDKIRCADDEWEEMKRSGV